MESYKAYKDSQVNWIGYIPTHWAVHPLGAHSTMIVPMRDKPTRFDGDIPWIRIEDLDGQFISRSKSEQNVSEALIGEMNLKIYPVGTVLCSCSCNLGVCAIVNKPLCSNQTFIGCVPDANELDSTFLYYLMGSMDRRLNYLSSGTIQSYLSRHDFEHLSIQVPPYHEQIAIAKYLNYKTSDIDALVADCEREVELLREYRKAVISEAVTKGLDPDAPMKDSDVEWIGEIPEGWNCVKLGLIATTTLGRMLDTDRQAGDCMAPYLSNRDVQWFCIDISDLKEMDFPYETRQSYEIHDGDLLVCEGGEVGRCTVWHGPTPPFYFQKAIHRVRFDPDVMDSDFAAYQMFQKAQVTMFREVRKGESTIGHLPGDQLRRLTFVVPPPATQRAIVDYLDSKAAEIDSLIEAKQSMADKLREYRRSLISEAVTGKFKVPGV